MDYILGSWLNQFSSLQLATWIATIIYHPWLPSTYEVTDLVEAPKEDHSPSNPGAPRPLVDLDSQYILNAAQVAVTDLNKMSNSLYKMVLVQVLQGTVQVYCAVLCMCAQSYL